MEALFRGLAWIVSRGLNPGIRPRSPPAALGLGCHTLLRHRHSSLSYLVALDLRHDRGVQSGHQLDLVCRQILGRSLEVTGVSVNLGNDVA